MGFQPLIILYLNNFIIVRKGKIMQSPLYFFTVEEYLELEQSSDIRHEYLPVRSLLWLEVVKNII